MRRKKKFDFWKFIYKCYKILFQYRDTILTSLMVFVLYFIGLLMIYIFDLYRVLGFDFVQYTAGFGGFVALLFYYTRVDQNEKQLEKIGEQINYTKRQIDIQDKTRKDQQFLDAVKLIEESNDVNSKIAFLKILENLSTEHLEYKQRILDYLGVHTEKLREFTKRGLNFRSFFNSEGEDILGFDEIYFEPIIDQNGYLSDIRLDLDEIPVDNSNGEINWGNYLMKYNTGYEGIPYDDSEGNELFDERYYYNVEIYLKDISSDKLKRNFYALIEKKHKFEKECLLLAQKIINMHSKEKQELIISNIFLPFIKIETIIETNLKLFSNRTDNLIGVQYQRGVTKNETNGLFVAPNYSVLQNCKHLMIFNEISKYIIFRKCKDMMNMSGNFLGCHFSDMDLTYSNFSITKKYVFEESSFHTVKFIPKGENELPMRDKQVYYPTIRFKNCSFMFGCNFEGFQCEELYFDNCEVSKEYPIQSLQSIQIHSKSEDELQKMAEGIVNLRKQNKEIGIPKRLERYVDELEKSKNQVKSKK